MAGTLKRYRLAFLLGLTWLSLGCSPAGLNFLLAPWVDDKMPPKCKLAQDKKEVTVAILCTFGTLETRPELLPTDGLLAERLAFELRKRSLANKEKIKIVPIARAKALVNENGDISLHEIGNKLKADYVIGLEINSLSMYEKGSSRTLFRGNAEIAVTVVDISRPHGEATVLSEIYRREYPGARGPIDAAGSSEIDFRNLFVSKMARELSRWFTAYPSDERWDMD